MFNYMRGRRRATVALAIGLVTVPSVALAATDAVPGDPFKLGQENRIATASTVLSGAGQKADGVLQVRRQSSGIGAVLKVVNETPGFAQRGIDITVPAGQTPINVNADAGKAGNLNADKLDGRDEEDFLSSSRLYRAGTPNLVQGPGNGKEILLTALDGLACDDGDVAIGGGGESREPNGDVQDDLNAVIPFGSSYRIRFQDNGEPSKFLGYVMCSDSARPFK